MNCQGANATVYCKVSNGNGSETMTKTINNSSGEFIIDSRGTYVAGKHEIEVWAVNSEYGITTEKIRTSYIKKGNISAIAIGKDAPVSATQYSTIKVPYYFYLPDNEIGSQVTIEIKVLYNSNTEEVVLTDQLCTVDDNHTSGEIPLKATAPLD